MQKLLRTALFSVFALLLAAGMAAAPVQAQDADADATVTVDADGGDNIEDGLESLNTELGNTSGGAGELVILANDYRLEGRVDLTQGASTDGLPNIENLTIVAEADGQSNEVTVEAITVDGGTATSNLSRVDFDSRNGGFIRVTDEAGGDTFSFVKSGQNSSTGDVTLDIESTGTQTSALRLANNATVTRDGNTAVATGSANAQYLDTGAASSLTYNTGGNELTSTPFYPSSGSVGTLTLNGGGGIDVRTSTTVETLTAGAGLAVSGDLTVTESAVNLNGASTAISANSIDVQGGDLTIDEAGQSVTASSGDLSVGSGSVTLSAGETGTIELDVAGELDVNGGITFGDANANASVGSNVFVSSVSATAGGESTVNDFDVGGTLNVGSSGVDLDQSGFEVAVASDMPIDDGGLSVDGNVVDVEGLLTVNTVSSPGSNGIEVSQSSGSVLSSSDLTVTVDGGGTNAISVTGGTVESETGPIDVNGDQVNLSSGATFDAAGDVSVTGGSVVASGSNTSATVDGALTVDVDGANTPTQPDGENGAERTGHALELDGVEFAVNGSGGTSIDGTGDVIRVQGDANVSLGDVTFVDPDPQFELAGLGSGANTGVTVGEVTADIAGGSSGNSAINGNSADIKVNLVEGGGDFTASRLDLNPFRDAYETQAEENVVLQANVVADNASVYGNFDVGTVEVEQVQDQSDDGTDANGTLETRVNLDVQEAGSDASQGRIVASGSDFSSIITNAGGDGTVTIEGSNATTFAGSAGGTITNDGSFTVETDATFNGAITNNGTGTLTANGATTVNADLTNDGTVDANAGLTYNRGSASDAITGTGTINIAADQTFTVDASGISSGPVEVLVDNGVAGEGTFSVNTPVTAEVIRGSDTVFPATETSGDGTVSFQIDDGDENNSINRSIEFSGGLTADASVNFNTSTSDNISAISVTDPAPNDDQPVFLDANADVDFTPASYNGSGAIVDVPNLRADNSATVNLSAAFGSYVETDDVTLNGSSTLDIKGNRLRVRRNFTRNNSPNPQITSNVSSVLEFFGTSDAKIDPGKDLLTFTGEIEIEKDNASGATVELLNPVRIDGESGAPEGIAPGVDIVRPDNNLATTTVDFSGNLIVRNGTFQVSNRSGGEGNIVVQTNDNELVFRDQDGDDADGTPADNVINTGTVISSIDRLSNRSLSGQDVLVKGSDTEILVSETLRALGGGFDLRNGSILNPADGTDDDAAEVIRGFPAGNPSSTQITDGNSGSQFNAADNTYDLAYEGEGTSTAGSELDTDFTRNVAVRDEVTLQLDQSSTVVTGDLTVGPSAVVEDDDNSDRTLTLSGSGTSHSIQGVVRGNDTNSEEVTLNVSGDNATITGGDPDGNDDGAAVENLTVQASGVAVGTSENPGLQRITGNLTVESGGLDLTLEDPGAGTDGNDNDDQTVAGYVELNGSQFTLGSPVEVLGSNGNSLAVDANSGEIALGANDLTLTGGGFEATESVTYDADVAESEEDRGEIVLDEVGTLATTDDGSTNQTPADIPNLRVEGDGVTGVSLGSDVGVSDWLVVNAGDEDGGGIDLNDEELSASGTVALNATTSSGATPRAVSGGGTFDVSDATVQVNDGASESTSLNDNVANQEVSTLTVSGGSEVTIDPDGNPARTLDVSGELALSTETGGSLNIQDNIVEVSGFAVTGTPGEAASVEAGDGYLAFNNTDSPPLTTDMTRGVNVDRLQVLANAELGDDGETFTVDETLWLDAQFDASATADAGQIAVGNEATIRRTEGYTDSNALTEAPAFAGDVSVVYNRIEDATAEFTAGPELPASDASDASLVELTVDAGPADDIAEDQASDGRVRFPQLGNNVSANPVTVDTKVDLKSGNLEHGTDGSTDLRRLTLSDGAVFAQKNGQIKGYGDTERDNIDASSYTLRYYPTEGDVTTGAQEFLDDEAVTTLEFIDPDGSAPATNLKLHDDRDVGSITVNRAATSSESFDSALNLDGFTLTASNDAKVANGELADNAPNPSTLVVNGTDGSLDNSSDLLIDGTVSSAVEVEGKTTVREGGTLSGEVIVANGEIAVNTGGTLTSTVSDMNADITVDGTMDVSSITTSGDIDASNASSVNFDGVTADGSSDQSIQVSEDPTPSSFTLAKSAPSSGGPPVVTFSGSTVDLSDGSDDVLVLNGGLLKPTGSTDGVDDNLVNLGSNDYSRDLSGSNAASESHVVGGVTKTVTANNDSDIQSVYPVGSEDPATYRRYRFTFPEGSVGQATDITVNHITEQLTGTSPLPITDDTGVTIGTDFPAYYWQVTADQDLTLTDEYSVAARVTGQTLTFNSSKPASDHRLIRRNRSDNPENTTWKVVGDGSSYANEGPVDGEADIRSQTSTADITNLGRVFTVGVPAGPGPMIATNSGLTLTERESATITSDFLSAQDDNNSADELTYTVTDGPSQGEIQVGGSQASEFTQADIKNGDVAYDHTASNADDDSFTFEVADPNGNTASGTFDVTVDVGTISIAGTVTYPTEGNGALGSGSGVGDVTVEARADGSVAGTATTNSDGTFTITGLSASTSYEVSASISKEVTPNDVNSNDAFRVVQGFVGTDAFVARFQELASVVTTGDDKANSTDALQIAQFGLGNTTADPEIPDDSKVGSWYSTTATVDVGNSDETGVSVQAAKYGDAELNAGPSGDNGDKSLASLSSGSASTASKSASDLRSVKAGETFEVPVRVSGTDKVGAYSLQLDYAADKASFEGVASGNDAMGNVSGDGTVRLGWFDASGGEEPIRVDGNESDLVTLRFKAARDVEGSFTPEITSGELTAPNGSKISGVQVNVEGARIGVTPDEFALQGSAPNPVKTQAQILMDLPTQSDVTVEVYNVLGQRVLRAEKSLSAGSGQSIQVDGADLSSGQYFYRVDAEMGDKTVRKTGRMTVVN